MFFETGCDASEVLDLVEEAPDVIALSVKDLGETMTVLSVDFVGDVRRRALGLDSLPDPVGVVGLVAENDAAAGKVGQQHRRAVGVVGLARGEDELDGQAPAHP